MSIDSKAKPVGTGQQGAGAPTGVEEDIPAHVGDSTQSIKWMRWPTERRERECSDSTGKTRPSSPSKFRFHLQSDERRTFGALLCRAFVSKTRHLQLEDAC
jgi:hypothetical protein